MIPIKIECGCGQKYAFEVEPVSGHMPTAVKCPSCGVDGTAAANAIIAQFAPAQPVVQAAPAGPVRVRLTASAPAPVEHATPSVRVAHTAPPAGAAARGREIDRDRVYNEARAKIFWGDAPDEVTKFVMMQGLDHQEASEMVAGMYKERLANLRVMGIKKIVIGAAMMCVPVVSFFFYMNRGYLPLKLFAIKVIVGLLGGWMFIKGAIMLLAPRLGSEDLADDDD
jgi:hypothetical protein